MNEKARKITGIVMSCIAYSFAIFVPIIKSNATYSIISFLAVLLEDAAIQIRKRCTRLDEINEIYQKCTEEEKEEIYEFIIKYDKTKTH